jgi:hypothetical protein
MMNDAFRKELQKFDAERVLFAWDGLLQKQQSSLEALGVPTMFPTDLQADREVSFEVTSNRQSYLMSRLETAEGRSRLGRYSRMMSIDCVYCCSMLSCFGTAKTPIA